MTWTCHYTTIVNGLWIYNIFWRLLSSQWIALEKNYKYGKILSKPSSFLKEIWTCLTLLYLCPTYQGLKFWVCLHLLSWLMYICVVVQQKSLEITFEDLCLAQWSNFHHHYCSHWFLQLLINQASWSFDQESLKMLSKGKLYAWFIFSLTLCVDRKPFLSVVKVISLYYNCLNQPL